MSNSRATPKESLLFHLFFLHCPLMSKGKVCMLDSLCHLFLSYYTYTLLEYELNTKMVNLCINVVDVFSVCIRMKMCQGTGKEGMKNLKVDSIFT